MHNLNHMKKSITSIFLFTAIALTASAANKTDLPSAINTFAGDLYSQLKTDSGNIFFSPLSISTTLSMTNAGARGNTADEMSKTLHMPFVSGVFVELAKQLETAQKPNGIELSLANSIWPSKEAHILDTYTALLKKDFDATVTPVDFVKDEPAARAAINRWVEEKTRQKIQNLIANPLDPNTRLLLVNAVYFKGDWARQFKKDNTATAPFYLVNDTTIDVPHMYQQGQFNYAEIDGTHIVELPYAGETLSMLVLVPKERGAAAFTTAEAFLSPEKLRSLAEWGLLSREVEIFLPRFKITWGTKSLKETLKALGIRDAFDATRADFSGINGDSKDLYIADVLHKAFVDVNEQGTEAAAATVGIMATRAMLLAPPVIRADHPFLFLIRDNTSGMILFIGRVANPTLSE